MNRIISLTVAAAALTLLVGGVSLAAQAPANNSNRWSSTFSARPPLSTPGRLAPVQATSMSGPTASFLQTHRKTRSVLPMAAAS
jgi:hypothetical protein